MDWFGFGAPKENAGVKTYSRAASKKKQKPSSLFTGLGSVHALADHPENVPYSKRKEQVCSPTKKEMKKLRSRRENPDSPRTKATLSTKIEAGHEDDIIRLAALLERHNDNFEGAPVPFSIIPEQEFPDSRHEDVVTWLEGLGFALSEGNLDQMAYKWTGSVLELSKSIKAVNQRINPTESANVSFSQAAVSRFRSASDSVLTSPLFSEKSASYFVGSPPPSQATKSVNAEETSAPHDMMGANFSPGQLGLLKNNHSPRPYNKHMQDLTSPSEMHSRSLSNSEENHKVSEGKSGFGWQQKRSAASRNVDNPIYDFPRRRRACSSPSTGTDTGSPARSLQSPFKYIPPREMMRSMSKDSVCSARSNDSVHSSRDLPILAGLQYLHLRTATNSSDDLFKLCDEEGQHENGGRKGPFVTRASCQHLSSPAGSIPVRPPVAVSSPGHVGAVLDKADLEPPVITAADDSVHDIVVNSSMHSDPSTEIENNTPDPPSGNRFDDDLGEDQEIVEANTCQMESLPPLAPRVLHRKNSKDSMTSLNYSGDDHRAAQDIHSLHNTSSDSHTKTLLDGSLRSPVLPPRDIHANSAGSTIDDLSIRRGFEFHQGSGAFGATFQPLHVSDGTGKRALRRSQTAPIAYHREPGLETPGAPVAFSQPSGLSSGHLCTPGQTLNPWRYTSEPASAKTCQSLLEMLEEHLKLSGAGGGETPRMMREYEMEAQAGDGLGLGSGLRHRGSESSGSVNFFESIAHNSGTRSSTGSMGAGFTNPPRLFRSFSAIPPGSASMRPDSAASFSNFPVFSNEKKPILGADTQGLNGVASLPFFPIANEAAAGVGSIPGIHAVPGVRCSSTSCIPAKPVDLEAFQGAQQALNSIISKKSSAAADRDTSVSFVSEASSTDKTALMRRRARKSASTWKRRSLGGSRLRHEQVDKHNVDGCIMDLSHDQSATRRLFSRSRRLSNVAERRASLLPQEIQGRMMSDDSDDDGYLNEDSYMYHDALPPPSQSSKVSARTFKGIVLGGTYQNLFDGPRPIITPPKGVEARVTAAEVVENGELTIRLFHPKDSNVQVVHYSSGWFLSRASPEGFLVGRNELTSSRNAVFYYLSKLPRGFVGSALKNTSCYSCEKSTDISGHNTSAMDCSGMRQDVSAYDVNLWSREHLSPRHNSVLDTSSQLSASQMDVTFCEEGAGRHAYWINNIVVFNALSFFSTAELAGCTKPASGHPRATSELIIPGLAAVNKTWAMNAYRHVASRLSLCGGAYYKYPQWAKFFSKFSTGKFLARGACKEVFKVTRDGLTDAVSVMDVDELEDRDMHDLVAQEVEIALMCSSMVTLHICPNLVEVYSIFRSDYCVPHRDWGIRNRMPAESTLTAGTFQFMHTEFCHGGDLEEVVRSKGQLDLGTVRSMLFQMCFSLYSCREQLQLRHFDVKLLNFFVTTGASLLSTAGHVSHAHVACETLEKRKSTSPFEAYRDKTSNVVNTQIGLGENIYTLELGMSKLDFAKLSDFGTSVIGEKDLGVPITDMQFTTLENTPPEFLIFGSTARQAYSADTFCLGLSYLHLLTGHEPYEELLKDVHCPPHLHTRLKPLWETKDTRSAYYVIAELLDSLDDDADGATSPPGMVLYDTFYRYLVLFGIPEEFITSPEETLWAGNPVVGAVTKAFGMTAKRQTKAQSACRAQYEEDRRQWGLEAGQNHVIVSARKRLEFLGEEAAFILKSMVQFDPSARCSMLDALTSLLFDPLRNKPGTAEEYQLHCERSDATHSQRDGTGKPNTSVWYMHYYKGHSVDASNLPQF